jgi:hypothetical protein
VHALKAHVKNGHLVVDEPTNLPDGAEVDIVVIDDNLDAEERAALHASLSISAAAMKESRHPDWVPSAPLVVGKIAARDPIVYQIDLWGSFALLAVQLEDLARDRRTLPTRRTSVRRSATQARQTESRDREREYIRDPTGRRQRCLQASVVYVSEFEVSIRPIARYGLADGTRAAVVAPVVT